MIADGRVDFVLEVTLNENNYKIYRPDPNREIYVFKEDIALKGHKVNNNLFHCAFVPQVFVLEKLGEVMFTILVSQS